MPEPIRILLQTTIPFIEDDWHIGRSVRANEEGGAAIAQSTFHHFADYHLDPKRGRPSFVTEAPGDGFAREPAALAETFRDFGNLAGWLGRRS